MSDLESLPFIDMLMEDESLNMERYFMNRIGNYDKQYTFYYDETNNIRKLRFKDSENFNILSDDLKNNFILGGIVFEGEKNFDDLHQKLQLQRTCSEFKSKHILKDDFSKSLKSKKLKIILDTLLTNNVFIHYHHVNLLYYSLVDIIDSIIVELNGYIRFLVIEDQWLLKQKIYDGVLGNLQSFIKLGYEYKFPHIPREKHEEFFDKFLTLLKPDIREILKFLLLCMNESRLIFIESVLEKEKAILESFSEFYYHNVQVYRQSKHIFDEEDSILKDMELHIKTSKYITFEDSKNDVNIQISDVIVGLIKQQLDFIKNTSTKEIPCFLASLDTDQKENLEMLTMLTCKSNQESIGFFHHTAPMSEIQKIWKVSEIFKIWTEL